MTRYERRDESLAPAPVFLRRVGRTACVAAAVVGGALLLGVLGYRFIAGLAWIDAILNASMILGGMGPVDTLTSDAAKLFASAYALFSGVVFIGAAGIIIAPFFHRLIHHFHLEADDGDDARTQGAGGVPRRRRR